MYNFTKEVDPTRPSVDASGGYHSERTDIFDVHCYQDFQTKQSYAYRIKFNKITLKKGDKLLRVHIPRTGARFERDEQVESYRLAADFFQAGFRRRQNVFTCESLKTIMEKGE